MSACRIWVGLAVIATLAMVTAEAVTVIAAQTTKADVGPVIQNRFHLPPAVAKSFREAFPRAEIQKLDVEEEDGVRVYDFEFRNGSVEQETDIAGDGTILEVTLVVDAQAVPSTVLKAIATAADGGRVGRIEKSDINYKTKDGKIVKLAKPATHFAAEIVKGGKSSELVFTPEGTRVKDR